MIISASRRTDIPAYYSEWFLNRIKEQYVCVRNPMKVHQVSKISLSPSVVDGIVFWTKNPIPMLNRLYELNDYTYYFQFSINSYGKDLESNIPSKAQVIIPAFQQLSLRIGKERVIWRYDPIIITSTYTAEYHVESFRKIAERLSGYTEKCIISFVDLYKHTQSNTRAYNIQPVNSTEMVNIASELAAICRRYGIALNTCAEKIDLSQFGIAHGQCIDCQLFERILSCRLDIEKDQNQREECGCVASIDIGAYNTCKSGCAYCYANYSKGAVSHNSQMHNPFSPLICGELQQDDEVNLRKVKSCKICQLVLFDS